MRALAAAVGWLALVIWIGAIASAGVAATGVFLILPGLDLRLEGYVQFAGDDSRTHGVIAGGRVMEPIFAGTDIVQAVAAVIVLLALTIEWQQARGGLRRGWQWIRVASIATAAALLAWQLLVLAPRMNANLRGFWNAAERGEIAAARTHRAGFDADHPLASRLAGARFFVLCLTVVATAIAQTPQRGASAKESRLSPDA